MYKRFAFSNEVTEAFNVSRKDDQVVRIVSERETEAVGFRLDLPAMTFPEAGDTPGPSHDESYDSFADGPLGAPWSSYSGFDPLEVVSGVVTAGGDGSEYRASNLELDQFGFDAGYTATIEVGVAGQFGSMPSIELEPYRPSGPTYILSWEGGFWHNSGTGTWVEITGEHATTGIARFEVSPTEVSVYWNDAFIFSHENEPPISSTMALSVRGLTLNTFYIFGATIPGIGFEIPQVSFNIVGVDSANNWTYSADAVGGFETVLAAQQALATAILDGANDYYEQEVARAGFNGTRVFFALPFNCTADFSPEPEIIVGGPRELPTYTLEYLSGDRTWRYLMDLEENSHAYTARFGTNLRVRSAESVCMITEGQTEEAFTFEGGVGYEVDDTITLNDGTASGGRTVLTVTAVGTSGTVTGFTVSVRTNTFIIIENPVIGQFATTGSGSGFVVTLTEANVTGNKTFIELM